MSQVGQFNFEEAIETLTGNSGDIVHPQVGNINIVGTDHVTVVGNNTTATLSIYIDGEIADTYTTDSGNAVPAFNILRVLGGTNINTAGATNAVTINLDESIVLPVTSSDGLQGLYSLGANRFMHARGTNNTFLGSTAGSLTLTVGSAVGNTGIGSAVLTGVTTGSYNVAVGVSALSLATTGVTNTAIGALAGSLFNGSGCTLIGKEAGISYVGSESYNIVIGNTGTAAESNKIRIGTYGTGVGQQDTAYIAGIVHASNGLIADAGDITPTLGSVIVPAGYISSLQYVEVLDDDVYIGNKDVAITAPKIQYKKSRGGGVITSGDLLGNVAFSGNDNAAYQVAAQIVSRSSGTIAADRVAGDIEFWTRPDVAAAITLRRVDVKPTGEVYIYTPDSGTALTVQGRGAEVTSGDVTLGDGDLFINNTEAAVTGPYIQLIKSRAGGVITTGDALGGLFFSGDDGSTNLNCSSIISVSSGTIAATRIGSDLQFFTHPDSTTISTQRMTIDSAGKVTINAPDSGDALTVTGGLTVTGIAGVTTTNTKIVTVNSSTGQVGAVTSIPASAGGSLVWTEVTGTTQAAAVMSGYITNNVALVTVTLPSTAAVGERVAIAGKGAGLWKIAQNSGQTVHFGSIDTTTGTGGYLAATVRYDCVELICTTADTDWVVRSSVGSITIV